VEVPLRRADRHLAAGSYPARPGALNTAALRSWRGPHSISATNTSPSSYSLPPVHARDQPSRSTVPRPCLRPCLCHFATATWLDRLTARAAHRVWHPLASPLTVTTPAHLIHSTHRIVPANTSIRLHHTLPDHAQYPDRDYVLADVGQMLSPAGTQTPPLPDLNCALTCLLIASSVP